jgi:protease-4
MRTLIGFLRGVWRGLDAFRRVLHLLLLLGLLALVVAALRQPVPSLPERAALVIHPFGELVEQLSGEPLERAISEAQGQGAPQTLLWDLTQAIHAAASDDRIQALLIETDDLDASGLPKLEELAGAISEFRATGKKVVARGSYFLQAQYFLAAQADELYLDPFGFVLLDGYARYRMYFKDALDKLAIDVHLIRAGKFKSAEEPFVRRDMSAEEREESTAYLQALWRGYRVGVGTARHKDPQAFSAYADGYANAVSKAGGDAALVARQAGMVTDLRTAAQVEQRLVELVGADATHHSFHSVSADDYLRVLRSEAPRHKSGAGAIAVVFASGEISNGEQPPGSIGGDSTAALLRRVREDDDLKALVLRIDSPGGSVLASEQIYREVVALRAAGKPVVVSMGDVAASGGYYIAAPADEILASANTITGSIGVFATVPTFDRTLAKLGVAVDGVGTTALSGVLRVDRPLKPEIEQLLQSGVEHSYGEFLQRVASGRHKSSAEIDAIAQGRVWAGSDALGIGLIDRLGGYQDALRSAAQRARLGKDYEVRVIEPDLSVAQQLLLNVRGTFVTLLRASGLARTASVQLPVQLQPLEREVQRWQRFSLLNGNVAYCFCSLR